MITRNKSWLTALVVFSIVMASFLVTAPTSTALAGGQQSITLTITQIETNTSWPNRRSLGVTIHFRVKAVGYKGERIETAVFFKYYRGQAWAVDSNGDYLNNTMDLVPSYDSSVWSDLTFWFPHSYFYNAPRHGNAPVFYAELQAKAPGSSEYTFVSSDVKFAVPVPID